MIAVVLAALAAMGRARGAGLAALVLAASSVLPLVPWLGYTATYFGRPALSGVVGISRPLWEGYWSGKLPGRVQADLTRLAEDPRLDADALRAAVRARTDDPAGLRYVEQWRGIHMRPGTPRDPFENIARRAEDERLYWAQALENIRADPAGFVGRRLAHGVPLLWIAEVPIRYSDINRVPRVWIYALWAAQAALIVVAAAGAVVLARRGHGALVALLLVPPLHVTLVHLPLLTEARQSLPLKPLVLAFAAVALVTLARARHLPWNRRFMTSSI
jgi:hypothetical protein